MILSFMADVGFFFMSANIVGDPISSEVDYYIVMSEQPRHI